MASHHASTGELRNLTLGDLQHEVETKRMHIAKMRMDIELKSEKDAARFRREKKEFARLLTVLSEKQRGGEGVKKAEKKAKTALKAPKKTSTVPAPK